MVDMLEKGITAGTHYGASYVELRAEDVTTTRIEYSDGHVDNLISKVRAGVACRVLYDGTWGFACGSVDDVESVVKRACSLAKAASPHRKEKIILEEIDVRKEKTRKGFKTPPQEVTYEEKIARLDRICALVKGYDRRVRAATIRYADSQGSRYLLTSEGTEIEQETGQVYNSCWVTGKDDGTLTAARDGVGSTDKGYEYFEKETEERIAERVGRRVILQLEGNPPRSGTFPCVLGPRVVGTLAHEALGHLAEADLTVNSSFNGKLHQRVAPPYVTMVDEPVEGTFGRLKYDDEGVEAQRVVIIEKGIFSGILTDRQYAHTTGMPPCGSSRAESFLFPPIIRMRNTFFEKGDYTEDELFEGIDFGYYCVDYRGGEAQLNSSFQVGVQEAFEIRKGEIGLPIKDLSISGVATETLFLIEGLGKTMEFEEGFCGKGQTAANSTGGPRVRVKEGGILFGGRE